MGDIFNLYRARLSEIIKSSGISQAEFAGKLGVARSYFHLLMNGSRRFNEDTIEKICEVLGVTPAQLFEGTAPLPPDLQRINDLFQNVPEYRNTIMSYHYLTLKAFREEIEKYEASKSSLT